MVCRSFSLALVATFAFASVACPAVAKTVFPIVGGPGDAGFEDRCPAGQYVVGLAGRAGKWIDRLRIVCAPMLASGLHGEKYYGPSRGGSGGAPIEFSCASDSYVYGARIALPDSGPERVTGVDLLCVSAVSGPSPVVFFRNDGELNITRTPTQDQCPSDELATGFAGRYGSDVNALGLLCDLHSATAAAPAPAPVASRYPIRLTGKAASTPAPAPQEASASSLVCPQGYVWREASPADHVCVTPAQRKIAKRENAMAASRVDATDGGSGAGTCVSGYVWREAYAGDIVCVTPRRRTAVAEENRNAPAQLPATP